MAKRLRLCGILALFIVVAPSRVSGDVYIMTKTYNLDPIPDLPADFGPDIPSDMGLEGFLKEADPADSCTAWTFQDFDTIWIALIARQQSTHSSLNCTFDIKVRHAQEAGAAAAIVYDDEYESLIIMSKPRSHPDPLIPAVFVSQKAGLLMKKLLEIEGEGGVRVRITRVSEVVWVSMVMSAVLGLLALTVVFSTFYLMRSWSLWLSGVTNGNRGPAGAPGTTTAGVPRPAADGGLPAHVLRALPVLIYESQPSSRQRSLPNSLPVGYMPCVLDEADLPLSSPPPAGKRVSVTGAAALPGEAEGAEGMSLPEGELVEGSSNSSEYEYTAPRGVHAGETKRTCTVCLEQYLEGEKLRVLPCHHRFHMACIDQWFQARRLCPMCKHDASKPLVGQAAADAEAAEAGGGGGGLSARLAGVRRAWLGGTGRGSGGGGPSAPASSNNRRGAIRSRIVRWMGLRPVQRQAVLSALAGEGLLGGLDEPLLTDGDVEEGGLVHAALRGGPQQPGRQASRSLQTSPARAQAPHTAPINIAQPGVGSGVASGGGVQGGAQGGASSEIHHHTEPLPPDAQRNPPSN